MPMCQCLSQLYNHQSMHSVENKDIAIVAIFCSQFKSELLKFSFNYLSPKFVMNLLLS
uniref:Uncharacterized protein n=1 Tax=Arundo donax TaxID=35708 RepID=A0A0A9GU30_ARUDO